MAGEEWGRRWSTWVQMDENARWRRVEKGPDDKEIVIDLVEEWFDEWWRNAGGRVRQGRVSRGVMCGAIAGWEWVFVFFPA